MPSYSHHLLHLQQMSAGHCSCSSGMSQLTATKTPSPTCPCCPSAAPPLPSSPPKAGQRLELHIQGAEHPPRGYQALAGHIPLLQPIHPHQGRCCQHGWGSGLGAQEHFPRVHKCGGSHCPGAVTGLSPPQGCLARAGCVCVIVCVTVCVCAAGCEDYTCVSSSSLRNPMSVVWGAGASQSGAVCSTPHAEGEGWELAPQRLNKEAPDGALKANPHFPAPSLFSFISVGSQLRADPDPPSTRATAAATSVLCADPYQEQSS